MSLHIFLQRFVDGAAAPLPYAPLAEFLGRHGTLHDACGDLELKFAQRGVIAQDDVDGYATLIGNPADGIQCIAIENPLRRDECAAFLFALMERFDLALFDDALDAVYVMHGTRSALPAAMAAACTTGVRTVAAPQQIWPVGLRLPPFHPDNALLLRYSSADGSQRVQRIDAADGQQRLFRYYVDTHPAACTPGVLRALRHATARVELARRAHAPMRVELYFNHHDVALSVLETPEVGDIDGAATTVSPPPPALGGSGTLQPPARFAAHRDADATARYNASACIEQAQQAGIRLDVGAGAAAALDLYVQAVRRRSGAALPTTAQVTECGWRAGSFWGELIRRDVGAEWGYLTLGTIRHAVLRTYSGRVIHPLLDVIDRLYGTQPMPLADQLASLVAQARSPSLDHDDFVRTINDACALLAGRVVDGFEAVPLHQQLPIAEMDFTFGSLRSLDRWVRAIATQRARFDDGLMIGVLRTAGAYVGEVVRAQAPHEWRWENYHHYFDGTPGLPDIPYQPVTAAVLLGHGKLVFPLAAVGERIVDPDAPSLYDWAVTTCKDTAAGWTAPAPVAIAADGAGGQRIPVTPADAAHHAARLVEFGPQLGHAFDWQLDSVLEVEHFVDKIHRRFGAAPLDEPTAEMLTLAGCYVGEVLARRFGARWRLPAGSRLAGHTDAPVVLETRYRSIVDPLAWVFARARYGSAAASIESRCMLVSNECDVRAQHGGPTDGSAAPAARSPAPAAPANQADAAAKAAAAARAAQFVMPPNRPAEVRPLTRLQLGLGLAIGPLAGMAVSTSNAVLGVLTFIAISGGAWLWWRSTR